MLTRTAYLLLEAHTYFKEFGYRPKSNDINFDEFLECAIKTIVRTKTFDDVHEAIRMYYFIYTQFDKICNKAKKYDYYWESLDYKGSKTINLVKKEEARGSYYVTNALTEDYNNVYVLSQSFDDDLLFHLCYKDKLFSLVDDEPEYYLRHSKLSSKEMVLLDEYKNKICVIKLTKDLNIELKDNLTDYDVIQDEGGVAIFKKDYLYSLASYDDIDWYKASAYIYWDCIEKDNYHGIARLDFYEEDADLELFILLAASTFLSFNKYIKGQRTMMLAPLLMGPAMFRRR